MKLYYINKKASHYFILIKMSDNRKMYDMKTWISKVYNKDMIIVKVSRFRRILTLEELLEEKYCSYMFYTGDIHLLKYNIDFFNKLSITFMPNIIDIKYLKKIVIK